MATTENRSRRRFLQKWVFGVALGPLAAARLGVGHAADDPLLKADDPAAKKVKYTEDATKAKDAAGNKCANCALYQGSYSSTQGPCQIFAGKQVKAAGWCSAWAPQI
jgi:hypothetical protein